MKSQQTTGRGAHVRSLVVQPLDDTRFSKNALTVGLLHLLYHLSSVVRAPLTVTQALRNACREVHRGLHLLINFRVLNYTACVKILKKHDKVGYFVAMRTDTEV